MAEQVLIRHARAGSRGDWEDDRLRPLSKKGRREAEALVESLAAIPLERVLSSPYVRCVQTVEPLARSRGLPPPEKTDALAEGAGIEAFMRLLREQAGRPSAFCAHGDLMYELSDELVRRGLVPRSEAGYEKGAAWILDERGGEIVGARYLPPPSI
jgi:phosphohistidine phosphatase SixA